MQFLHSLRLEQPYTEVPRPSGPEIPKKSQQGLRGPPGPECQQSVEKVPQDPKRVKRVSKSVFGNLFDTVGGEAREDLVRLFWDFGSLECGDFWIWALQS